MIEMTDDRKKLVKNENEILYLASDGGLTDDNGRLFSSNIDRITYYRDNTRKDAILATNEIIISQQIIWYASRLSTTSRSNCVLRDHDAPRKKKTKSHSSKSLTNIEVSSLQ